MGESSFRRLSARKAAVLCSTMLSACVSTVAQAQTGDVPTPPVRQAVDDHGVNLATGLLEMGGQHITIGAGASGMDFATIRPANRFWYHPWRYAIYDGGGAITNVILGPRTLNFAFSGGAYVNQQATGVVGQFEI